LILLCRDWRALWREWRRKNHPARWLFLSIHINVVMFWECHSMQSLALLTTVNAEQWQNILWHYLTVSLQTWKSVSPNIICTHIIQCKAKFMAFTCHEVVWWHV